jgi:hypothetical protein
MGRYSRSKKERAHPLEERADYIRASSQAAHGPSNAGPQNRQVERVSAHAIKYAAGGSAASNN